MTASAMHSMQNYAHYCRVNVCKTLLLMKRVSNLYFILYYVFLAYFISLVLETDSFLPEVSK